VQCELYDAIRKVEGHHWWYVGFNLDLLKTHGHQAFGADISGDAVRFCRERGTRFVVQADAARPPFKNASFDLMLALDVRKARES